MVRRHGTPRPCGARARGSRAHKFPCMTALSSDLFLLASRSSSGRLTCSDRCNASRGPRWSPSVCGCRSTPIDCGCDGQRPSSTTVPARGAPFGQASQVPSDGSIERPRSGSGLRRYSRLLPAALGRQRRSGGEEAGDGRLLGAFGPDRVDGQRWPRRSKVDERYAGRMLLRARADG